MSNIVMLVKSIGGLTFDAVLSEKHSAQAEVTENPVESGVSITDHMFVKPYRVNILAGVSATPMREANDAYGLGVDRMRNAYEALLLLQKTREPFDVVTGLKLYRNMVCTGIDTEQDKDTAGALVFSAELREVIIVFTESVKYPPRRAGTTNNQASKKREQGEKQAKEEPAGAAERKGSFASKVMDALGKNRGQ